MEIIWKKLTKEQLITSPEIKRKDLVKEHKMLGFIEAEGLMKNLVVIQTGKKYTIIDGNKLYQIAIKAGIEEFMCCIVNKPNPDFIRLMLNSLIWRNDLVETTFLVNSLSDSEIEMTPFTTQMIETFKDLLKFDWNQYHNKNADLQPNLL